MENSNKIKVSLQKSEKKRRIARAAPPRRAKKVLLLRKSRRYSNGKTIEQIDHLIGKSGGNKKAHDNN